jgi:hypothetical protein
MRDVQHVIRIRDLAREWTHSPDHDVVCAILGVLPGRVRVTGTLFKYVAVEVDHEDPVFGV